MPQVDTDIAAAARRAAEDGELQDAVDRLNTGWRFAVDPHHPGRWLLRDPRSEDDGWSYAEDRVRQVEDAHRAAIVLADAERAAEPPAG